MKLGEVSPGGVGVGLNGLLVMVILAVFIAGLMVGPHAGVPRARRSRRAEMKLVALYILAMPRSCSSASPRRRRSCGSVTHVSICNPGPHGFTELLYAFTSAGNNNGSAFAGHHGQHAVDEHDPGASRMLFGRFFLIIPTLATRRLAWCASGACPRP